MQNTGTEKRHHKRKLISLNAKIISGGTTYSGIIVNLSEEGIYMLTAASDVTIDFSPESRLRLVTELPTKEILGMDCSVKWFQKKTSPKGPRFKIGMEIIDPPLIYIEFAKSHR